MHEIVIRDSASSHTLKSRLIVQVRTAASLLRRESFDTQTREGRSLERYRRAVLTTASSGAARGISLVAMLISVPLTVRYLGNERYALWVTISSIINLLSFADLGLGNGLLNVISESHGREDRDAAAQSVSSAFLMLVSTAAVITMAFLLVYPHLPWTRIFNLTSPVAIREAGPATAIFVACIVLNLPLGVVQRVQLGYQQGFVNNLWASLGSILGLCGLLLAIHLRLGLQWLVLAIAGAPVLAVAVNSFLLFGIQRPWLRPRYGAFSFPLAKRIVRLGVGFFIMQLSMTFAYQCDNIVLAQILGAAQVTQYAVPLKLFMIAPAILYVVVAPLWPAYSEALARGDHHWVRKTLQRSLILGLGLMIPANVLLVVFGNRIIHLWVGAQIHPPLILLIGLASWGVLTGLNSPLAMFLNGLNVIGFQAICACFNAIASLLLGIVLTKRIGIAGTVYGMIAAQIVCILVPLAFYMPTLLKRLSRSDIAEVAIDRNSFDEPVRPQISVVDAMGSEAANL